MVRLAGDQDIDFLNVLARKFYDVSVWSDCVGYNAQATESFLLGVMEKGVIFRDGHGMCGGVLHPLFFNPDAKIAVELFWFSEGDGRALRQSFEGWAKEQSADLIQMTCLANEKEIAMRRLFRGQGYEAKEVSLFKVI